MTTAMATAAVPQMRSGVVSKFGVLVAGDLSLNDNVDYLNRYVLNRRTDLFVQVAKAAAGKGLDFAEVAMTSDCDTALLFYGSQLAAGRQEFGILVSDDATLDQQVVAINSHIRDFGQREILLAQAVPVVPGKSFDLMVIAMLVTP